MSKVKGLIFDLDGVLVDTKNIHFESLNIALKKISNTVISYNDHLNYFDGLPTLKKLQLLNEEGLVNKRDNSKILKIKQQFTLRLLKKNIKFNKKVFNTFFNLSKNIKYQ